MGSVAELLDIFMPEDLCARCGVREVTTQKLFFIQEKSSENNSDFKHLKLGFCDEECLSFFVRGISAAQEMRV